MILIGVTFEADNTLLSEGGQNDWADQSAVFVDEAVLPGAQIW